MGKIWEDLEQAIQKKYQLRENEWVQVSVSKRGKVHVTIVSDSDIKSADIRKLLEEEFEKRQDNYQIGFINIYSTEQAEELHIEKLRKRDDYISWSDALYADEDVKSDKTEAQVISFYSYKGGVGRTIALIETAYNLTKKGKRVLLLDLDVEAPSLHNIFREQVNDEVNGAKCGIIEYLYKKVVQGSEEIQINDIFCSLQLKNVSGEIFVMPALKVMNKDYVYQIERLQTQQIQEKDIFSEIFAYVKKTLNVDIIMIDTRAGFNQWGSLSLLTLSNQVIFVAYPNDENIEGLNMALQLMQNIGKKRYAVAMSKVVVSEEGVNKAKSLFEKLNVPQEDLIPIYYKQEIALSNCYPIESDNILSAYKDLSDYILNNEKIERNQKFLINGMKEKMLRELFQEKKALITLSFVRNFRNQNAIMLLKYHYKEELHGLRNGSSVITYRRRENAFIPATIYTVVNDENDVEYKEILKTPDGDIESVGIKLILLMTKKLNEKTKWWKGETSEITKISQLLQGLSYQVEDKPVLIRAEVDGPLVRASKADGAFITTDELHLVINITSDMLMEDSELVLDNIRGLLSFFNKEIEEIQFSFMVQEQVWEEYPELSSVFKGNLIEADVTMDDIKNFILANIKEETFLPFMQYIKASQQVIESGQDYAIEDFFEEMDDEENIDIILGIRKDVKMYSQSVVEYLHEFLRKHKTIKYTDLLDMLKQAAEKELEDPDEQFQDRLISFSKLQQELDRVSGCDKMINRL